MSEENNAIKKEIDDVIPKSMDESTAKAEEYSESDDRQIKQDKKPSGQKELLKEADTYGKGTQMSFADVPLLSEEAVQSTVSSGRCSAPTGW